MDRKKLHLKKKKLIWNWQNTSHFCQNDGISLATLTYSTSGELYWIKKQFIIETNSVKNGCSFPQEHSPIVPGLKSVFWKHKSSQKPISKCMFQLGF